jgi:putative isomerase
MAAPRATFLVIATLALSRTILAGTETLKAYERPEYLAIRNELVRGWGTWDTRDALAQVLLPDGLSVSLSFKRTDGSDGLVRPKMVTDKKGTEFRAGMHALDGSYSESDIDWKGTHLHVQSATQGDDLVILVTPLGNPGKPFEAVVTIEMVWGKLGVLSGGGRQITAQLPSRVVSIYATGSVTDASKDPPAGPSLVRDMTGAMGVSTGKPRTVEEILEILRVRRDSLSKEAANHGELAEPYTAIQAAIGWSTIYDPGHNRIVTIVSRDWNMWFGGYVMFGWDNFFLPYVCSLFSRDLAYANFAEHMRSLTPDGFIANVDETGGKTSWDRSQPPVGSLMLKEIYKRFGDRWILEASFDDLLTWNRWWAKKRMNGKLLGWGSDLTNGPLHEKEAHTAIGAAWESGMDDSPMFEGVPFNPQKNMFELQDVGLNGLYVADCRALAEIADVIGRKVEAAELRLRAEQFSRELETLWNRAEGLYLNRRMDTREPSRRITPTMFYPLIGRVPTRDRAEAMVDQHLMNPTEFGGEYVIPSIARSDPAFPTQHYWRGAIWPPLNFLVYLGLRNYDLTMARHELETKSMAIFLGEWRRKGFISENYSAVTGTGDDPNLTSTPFYSWGVLMGMMGFIEAGEMPVPEASISDIRAR